MRLRLWVLSTLFAGGALASGDSDAPSELNAGLQGANAGSGKRLPRPWYQIYESNVKTIIFYSLSAVVVIGFLGDKYYEHLRLRRKSARTTSQTRKQERPLDTGRQEVLAEAIKTVIRRRGPDA
ncbi:ACP5 [Symbiodinium natans]|uniref:ACP5 protein n=1 Tax=Symbiodinium natans TaxID=878477 RepID=A0A812LWR5_9DINO|nr:ACP5 [Symbiodinium natans]